jgi:UDP:flavonoid glycosyltransferase YjiC (YdhE family)
VSLDIKDERILTGVTELMENDSYYHAIERLNRMSKLHKTEENICLVVEETL